MSRVHRFIPEKRAITVTITGPLVGAIVQLGVSRMLQDPRYDPQARILVDLRAVTHYDMNLDAVDWLTARQPLPGAARKAYVVSSGFGQGLMSLIAQQSMPGKVRIFWALNEALDWINAGCPAEQAMVEADLCEPVPAEEPAL